jgi:hypothetical protein
MKRLFTLIGLTLLFACEPALEDEYEVFIIQHGEHYSRHKVEWLQSRTLNAEVIFDETAVYSTVDPVNQHDINKLIGFADCNSVHHENSARIGWRWLNNQLELHAYAYVNGERLSEFIATVPLNAPSSIGIELLEDAYEFTVNDNQVQINREHDCSMGTYYMLFPYFGGDEPAPQDISILIKRSF